MNYRIHVFVAIGIGGTPSQTEKLFLTSLQNIGLRTEVSEADLIPCKRNTACRFFFDTVQLKLFQFPYANHLAPIEAESTVRLL